MKEERAREILKDWIDEDGGLFSSSWPFVLWVEGNREITLDDEFDAETLEAIAWWMKNT